MVSPDFPAISRRTQAGREFSSAYVRQGRRTLLLWRVVKSRRCGDLVTR